MVFLQLSTSTAINPVVRCRYISPSKTSCGVNCEYFREYLSCYNGTLLYCLHISFPTSLLGTCLMYRPVFCNGTSVCCGAPFLFGNFFRHAHDGYGYGYGGYQGGPHRSGGYRGHQGFGPIGGFNLNGHVDTYEHNSHGGYGGWADYGGAHDQAQGFGHIPYNSRYVVWKKKRK